MNRDAKQLNRFIDRTGDQLLGSQPNTISGLSALRCYSPPGRFEILKPLLGFVTVGNEQLLVDDATRDTTPICE